MLLPIYAKLKAKIMDKFAPKERNKRRKTKITDLGIGENDLWIAATAIENNLIVVYRISKFQINKVKNIMNRDAIFNNK